MHPIRNAQIKKSPGVPVARAVLWGTPLYFAHVNVPGTGFVMAIMAYGLWAYGGINREGISRDYRYAYTLQLYR